MAIITNSIGTTGRDYSTLQAWEDAIPADVVASGNSYVGECYNDSEFSAGVVISAHNTDATHTITLTAATGQSFQDHPNVRSNALVYDQSKGVGILVTASYSSGVDALGLTHYLTVTRLQIKTTHAKSFPLVSDSLNDNLVVKDCILQGNSETANVVDLFGELINCLVIQDHATGDGIWMRQNHNVLGCTIVRTTNNSPAGTGVIARNYADITLRSTAIFGFTNPTGVAGTGAFDALCSNNASDGASLPGASNQINVPFSNVTPFSDADNTGTDLKAIVGTALVNNGIRDSGLAPDDITGEARDTTPTIGVWELIELIAVPFFTTVGAKQI